MKQTVGITGANGYLGSRIADVLSKSDFRIVKMVRRPLAGDRRFELDGPIDEDLLKEIDILVHCAWDMRLVSWKDNLEVNVGGTMKLLELCKKVGLKQFVFISTISAFDGCESLYGKAKMLIETEVLHIGGTVIRPGLVYGNESGGMIGAILKLAELSPVLPMVGSGRMPMFTCHEDDLVALVRSCCEQPLPAKIVTAAEQKPRLFRDIVQQLADPRLYFVPIPWRLIWIALKMLEGVGIRTRLKSDSLVGLVKANPAPDFSETAKLSVRFRPLSS